MKDMLSYSSIMKKMKDMLSYSSLMKYKESSFDLSQTIISLTKFIEIKKNMQDLK